MKSKAFLLPVVMIVCACSAALATPPNTPTLDGRPIEYDLADRAGLYTGSSAGFDWGAGNVLTNVFVTWDSTYLYVALQGFAESAPIPNKLTILVDVDPGNGTGPTATTNWGVSGEPGYIIYNEPNWTAATNGPAFGLDYMLASEGTYNNILRVIYDDGTTPGTNNIIQVFDQGNGSSPAGTPADMASNFGAPGDLRGFEARIPWGVLYNDARFGTVQPGEVVPRGAQLRLVAHIHNNQPLDRYSSPVVIPKQVTAGFLYDNGRLITADYLDVALDPDSNGIPNVATGDVNAPYLSALLGLATKQTVYAMFNEGVTTSTSENASNWDVAGNTPSQAQQVQANAVLLTLTNTLPTTNVLVKVTATGVEDSFTNSRTTYAYFYPSAGGIETALTVRFYLETASGMGLNPGCSNFFINGSSTPLEWGYPPAKSSPLSLSGGTMYYRDVTFPPGTPAKIYYKYSGELSSGTSQGTNNFEAIRLENFANASRTLSLPTNGTTSMVLTDYLGVAAHPWRDPNNTNLTAYKDVYLDTQRGDAGVRERRTMLFQLDLSQRDLTGITRILVQGTDPLRGFNVDGNGVADWAGGGAVGWSNGGLTLYDNGSNGDLTSGDKIYSRLWSFTTSGKDSALVGFPNSLVGGTISDVPYAGFGWLDRRTPRSFAYKFYVVRSGGSYLESPSANIEYYIEAPATNIVLSPFLWDNTNLPLPPPSNTPTMVSMVRTGATVTVLFTNVPSELQHGVHVSTNLPEGWKDYGQRASGSLGQWQSPVKGPYTGSEFYRAYSGPGVSRIVTRWSPNPLPDTGGTLRVWFSQITRNLAGERDVRWYGNVQPDGTVNDPWTDHSMTFLSNGLWYGEIPVKATNNGLVRFVFRNGSAGVYDKDYGYSGADQYRVHVGGRATWTPEPVARGGSLAVSYDSTGGPLDGATGVWIHAGFDKFEGTDWSATLSTGMTQIVSNQWTVTIPVPTNAFKTRHFLFRNPEGTVWDNQYDPTHWHAFIDP